MTPHTFALVDCNNFYASCERVFRPDLQKRPVAILSNNDGCVIARTNELKPLIRMAKPAHEVKELLKSHNAEILSANFSLYGDMSRRVMKTLKEYTPHMEVYSIDEAFMLLDHIPHHRHEIYGQQIRTKVQQWTGIPVSIGIAPTKTLAKLANELAKKKIELQGVLSFGFDTNIDEWLEQAPVADIWGIGYRHAELLNKHGVYNALQFKQLPDAWIRKNLSVTGLRTALELRGIRCFSLHEQQERRKSIICSRSFGYPITECQDLEEVVASFIARAAEKLREQDAIASGIKVYLETNTYSAEETPFSTSTFIPLPVPTAYTPELIKHAQTGVREIFTPQKRYKKAGVVFTGILANSHQQTNLFYAQKDHEKEKSIMQTVDGLNEHFGENTVTMAAEGVRSGWYIRQEHRTPRYTTQWKELPTAH